jgi:hypothetical protein
MSRAPRARAGARARSRESPLLWPRLLDRAGLPATSLRAWSAYFEALLFLQRPVDALRPVRTGNHIALAPLASIEVGLEVIANPFSPAHAERFQDATTLLDSDPLLAHFTALITAEFGVVLVCQGHHDRARPYLEQAKRALDHSFFAHTARLRCRRLEGLLLLAEGSAEGAHLMHALAREARAEGRPALAEQIVADLQAQRLCRNPP